MNCKFCNAQLEEEVTVCPSCGKNQEEELSEEILAVTHEAQPEAAEAVEEIPFTIGALIDEREFYMPGLTEFAILYPYSMKDNSSLKTQIFSTENICFCGADAS